MKRHVSRVVDAPRSIEAFALPDPGGMTPFLILLSLTAQEIVIGRAITTPIRFNVDIEVEAECLIRNIAAELTATAAELEECVPQRVRIIEEVTTAIVRNPSLAYDFARRVVTLRRSAKRVAQLKQGGWRNE